VNGHAAPLIARERLWIIAVACGHPHALTIHVRLYWRLFMVSFRRDFDYDLATGVTRLDLLVRVCEVA
jgi:hypothetical protein